MNKFISAILFSSALVISLPVAAHTEEYFDSVESPHGGQTRMSGAYHLELVARNNEIMLYVMDHADNAISTEGGLGKATVQNGKAKGKTSVKLEPAGDNLLRGAGEFSITPETVVVVFVELPGQEVHSARFMPLKPKTNLVKKAENAESPADSKDEHRHHGHH
ncbi:MAG TPA: hypothetical protein VFS89_01635 [Nitrosospira sp.]|nr:hypothetical protein [Nitrosospira sp.]